MRTNPETSPRRLTLDGCVAQAMDGEGPEIVPYLPYILKDAWELGTLPGTVIDLVRRHLTDPARLRVLDLGCGKGAVSVRLAHELGCRCLGIDALAEFIAVAREKAAAFGVRRRCRFEVGDIRDRIRDLGRFDVTVLGAIGPVFGGYRATLDILAPHLGPDGLIVLDDGYLPDDSPHRHPLVVRRSELLGEIESAGMRLVEEVVVGAEAMQAMDEVMFRGVERRCRELIARHPDKRDLFEGYIRRQVEENDWLESRIVCAVMAIRKQ
ncbi:MAG TPA: class I SAM-dependent methyltransferase [Acidobacteriota bacterium]|nr:class I SAM-dependent methyltransferase [Acidobacteriota bacterium]HNU00148.1 class I SAM-dependent methyltransferase [Acidobacteriota bacterium]